MKWSGIVKKNKEFYLIEKKTNEIILKIEFVRKFSEKERKRILKNNVLSYWKGIE